MNRNKSIVLFIIMGLSLFFSFLSVEAQGKKGWPKKNGIGLDAEKGFGFATNRAPIYIDSDSLEANQKTNTIIYKGNVVAKQEDTTLYAQTLTILYDPDKKRLKEIIATGNVKVVQLNRRFSGKKATFDQDKNQVILDGDATVREGTNIIRGERIIYYVDEERSVVEGGRKGRVSTMFTPPPKNEETDKKPEGEGKK